MSGVSGSPQITLGWFPLPKIPLKRVNLLFSFVSASLPPQGKHGGTGRRELVPVCSWVSLGSFFHHIMAIFWWLLPSVRVTRVAFPIRMGTLTVFSPSSACQS